MSALDLVPEAERQLVICNACRYCEGYCPVFQAIETRREFPAGEVFYLAHLCHDCRGCYYACMYTPPHEFAINIPKILAEARVSTYRRWSWPTPLARAFGNNSVGAAVAGAVAAAVVLATSIFVPPAKLFAPHTGPGAFYEVVPYAAMVVPALVLFLYGIAMWIRGAKQFWKEAGGGLAPSKVFEALGGAFSSAVTVRYLQGGGPGCYYPDERPSSARRMYHALVYAGFFSALVSTTLAFIYEDFLRIMPPYRVLSAPVIFGTLGGIALIVGTAGLLWLKPRSDREPSDASATGLDYAFLIILGLASLSGMATLVFRATSAMGVLLTWHLAMVAAMFASAPYGKFVHFVYRSLALLRYRVEQLAAIQKSGGH